MIKVTKNEIKKFIYTIEIDLDETAENIYRKLGAEPCYKSKLKSAETVDGKIILRFEYEI